VAAFKAMAQHPLHASMRLPPSSSSSSSLLPSSSAWDDAGVFCSLDESAYCINWCKKKQARHKANPDGTISLERFVQAVRYFDPEASDGKSTASSSVFTMRLYHEGTYFVDVRLKSARKVDQWCAAINRVLLLAPHPFIEVQAAVDEEIKRKIADFITSRAQQNPKLLLSGSLRKKGADFIGLWKKRFVVVEQSPLNEEYSLVYYKTDKDYKEVVEVRETLRAAAARQTAATRKPLALGKLMIRDIDRVVVPSVPSNAGPVRFFNLQVSDRLYQLDAGADCGELGDNFVLLLRSLRTKAVKRKWRDALLSPCAGQISVYINSFVFHERDAASMSGVGFDVNNKRGMFVEVGCNEQKFRTKPCVDTCGAGNSRAPTWQQVADLEMRHAELQTSQLVCQLGQGCDSSIETIK
jgi:hypothetical protein